MCECHRRKKVRCFKRKSRRLEKQVSKFTNKTKVKVNIVNKPKNVNKNLLVNFDPDFTEATSGLGTLI